MYPALVRNATVQPINPLEKIRCFINSPCVPTTHRMADVVPNIARSSRYLHCFFFRQDIHDSSLFIVVSNTIGKTFRNVIKSAATSATVVRTAYSTPYRSLTDKRVVTDSSFWLPYCRIALLSHRVYSKNDP